MATIEQNLERLNNVKTNWRQALINQGQTVAENAPLESYVIATGSIEPKLQNKSITIKENGTTTINADSNYDGLNEVEITTDVAGSTEGIIVTAPTSSRYQYSTTKYTVPAFIRGLMYATYIDAKDVPAIENMQYMFVNMSQLTKIDNLNTSIATSLKDLCYGCSALTEITITDTPNVTDFSYAFHGCRNLVKINGTLDVRNAENWSYMFGTNSSSYTSKLQEVRIKNIYTNFSFSFSTVLSHDSLVYAINNLVENTGEETITLTLGTTNLSKLTEEEKAVATEKGWTLA